MSMVMKAARLTENGKSLGPVELEIDAPAPVGFDVTPSVHNQEHD
jgi:hypothetical protein